MKFILTLFFVLMLCSCWKVSDGEKSGIIVKLSSDGILFKTNEAELIRGGLNQGSGTFGKPFDFTVSQKNLLEQVKIALDSQKEVKIYYHKDLLCFLTSESDCVYLDNIKI